jgi:hypothetical protein
LSRWLPINFPLLLNLFVHSNKFSFFEGVHSKKLSSLYSAVSCLSRDAVLTVEFVLVKVQLIGLMCL